MHMSHAKHSFGKCDRRRDRRTDRQTDGQTTDKVIPMCHYASQATQKLDRKQDRNVLYQECVFRPIWKTRWQSWPLIGWDIFDFSKLKPPNGIQWNLTGSKISTSSTKFVFFRPIGKTRLPAWPLICWDIFDFSSETAERNSTKLDRKQDINVLYQVCVFRVDWKKKMTALASDLLRHLRLLLWDHWTEFNETWREARSQYPLPSLCFYGPVGKTKWLPWPLIGWDIFDFSSETAERNSTKLNRKQDLSLLYQVCDGLIGKTRWPPWPLIGWDIFDFSSETAGRNSTKLDRKQDLNVLYQVCVFWANQKQNKMAAQASDWLRHFRLLLWNRWTEFNETWQEARSQRPLPSLCFSCRSEKQDARPGLWLAETFSTSPLKPLNGIQRNLTGSKISTSFTKFVFFGPIRKNKMAAQASDCLRHFRLLLWNRWTEFNETWQEARSQRPPPSLCFSGRSEKTRWPPWPLIGWDIFDFSSETAEQNSTKLDRKQDLNVLYQVCVFQADQKNKMAALASDWLRHFRLLLWNRWTEFNETWQEARSQRPLPSLCFWANQKKQDGRPGLWLAETFSTSPLKPLNRIQRNLTGSKISTSSSKFVFFGPIGKTRWPPWPLIGWDIFDFSSETAERNSTKLDRKQDLNVLSQVCVFRADRKNKMAALASDWLRHFRLLLWNRWTEFNETWQEARSQRPLPSLCFWGWSEKQDGRPGLWLAETFSTSPLKLLNGIQRNLTRSKIWTSSTKFVFFVPIGKTRWPPWPLIGWDIFIFSSKTAEQTCQRILTGSKISTSSSEFVFFGPISKQKCPPWQTPQKGGTLYSGVRYVALWASCCFSGRWENKNGRPGWSVKKMTHWTHVQDMWPFLVHLSRTLKCTIQSVRRGAAGTCRPSRAVKTFRGIIFLFSKIIHFRFVRKKETYLPVQKFVGSINSYTQCILWTIFYHVVTSLNWNWKVCKRKYCLNGRKFSRTFFGPKNWNFQNRYKKWLSTELNHTLKNWRKIKHLRGNKNSDLPE